jgi:hypothetical protein
MAWTSTKAGSDMTKDAQLIKELGGPAKLAEQLGFHKKGGTQRVQNWLYRGIPSDVKLSRPDLFLKGLSFAPRKLKKTPV